jgi:hypothetical protein
MHTHECSRHHTIFFMHTRTFTHVCAPFCSLNQETMIPPSFSPKMIAFLHFRPSTQEGEDAPEEKKSGDDRLLEGKKSNVVEERRSARGYKFSVVNVDDTGEISEDVKDDDDWSDEALDTGGEEDTDNDSRIRSRSRSRSRGEFQARRGVSPLRSTPQMNLTAYAAIPVAPVSSAAPVKSLIDVWSQVGAQSDSADESGSLALNLIDASGAIPDAAPYTRLIQEQARAAAAGDKRALDKAFKVRLIQIPLCVFVCVCVCMCIHTAAAGTSVSLIRMPSRFV